jgi:hypothetical protein
MIATRDEVNISMLVLGIQKERRIQGQSPSRARHQPSLGGTELVVDRTRPKAKEASLTVPLSILNREV